MKRLFALLSKHRRRVARVVFGLGLLAVASQLFTHVPRETEVEFALGDRHAHVVEVRVGFERGGEEMHGVSFGFPRGAPSTIRHSLRLPSGEYVVRAELRERDGETRHYTRKVVAPADGVVQIPLTGRALLDPGGRERAFAWNQTSPVSALARGRDQ